jgi:hypothetical protein
MPRVVLETGPTALRRIGRVQVLEQILEVTDLGDMPVAKPRACEGVNWLRPGVPGS